MRYQLSILIIVFSSLGGCVSTSEHIGCGSYDNGRYIQYLYNPSGLGHWTKMTLNIEKRDSFEIVTREYPITDTAIYKVTWVDHCKYKLIRTNPKDNLDSFMVRQNPKGLLRTVKKVTSEYLLIKSKYRLDTLWKKID